MRKIKNILLLAGGDSTRFWPLEDKLFFRFLGEPFILLQIKELLQYCDLITVVANKANATAIKRLVDNADLKSVQILIQKDEFSGMAGAIFSAKGHIKGELLIVNGSDLIDYSIVNKFEDLITDGNKLILVGKKQNEYFPGGYFKFNDEKKIIEIVEKPGKDNRPSMITKLVFDYFSEIDDLLENFSEIKTNNDNLYELAINKILSQDIKRSDLLYDSFWYVLKYPWHILSMLRSFLINVKNSRIAKSAVISDQAVLIGNVIIGENVKIGEFTKIVGPAYIGDNTIIGDFSLVRESQIGDDCLVGSFTEVARSYIGNNVYLHRNYVGDSVLDDGVMFGAQVVTSNLKFDGKEVLSNIHGAKIETNLFKLGAIVGKHTKVGVNTTIFPGIKIGHHSWIGPRESLRYDLGDKMYLDKGKEKLNLKV